MSLDDRLLAVGLDPAGPGDPEAAFRVLHDAMGEKATVVDRYLLEVRHRGIDLDDLCMSDRLRLGQDVLSIRGYDQIGQPSGEPVVVEAYDPDWAEQFETWRSRLAAALGDTAVTIDHMGSTAVVDLASKPIVDVVVGVRDVEDEVSYVGPIESSGVVLRSRDEGHRYFRPAAGQPRVVQIHVSEAGGAWRREHLLFRDYLSAHPASATEYGTLKQGLATEFAHDRLAYTDLKGVSIRATMRAAEEWGAASRWSPS